MKAKSDEGCGRKGDLISFVYEEMSEAGKDDFSRHLRQCRSCADEAAAFGRVREELGAWETGRVPATEWERPREAGGVVESLLLLFPAWARGLALTAVAAGLLLVLVPLGRRGPAVTPAEIDNLVREAVARERAQIENEYRVRNTAFEEKARRDYQEQLEKVSADYELRLQGMQASLRAEMRNRGSIRSYFALGDGYDAAGRSLGEER